MTTYYISPDGSDANNGLGPDQSHGTNRPWLTLGKAMNTGSPVAPGDTVYLAPGDYFSTSATPISGITSTGSPTTFAGDPLNAQGFKNGSGVRRSPGPVMLTRSASAAVAGTGDLITMTTNNPLGLILQDLCLHGIVRLTMAGNTNLLIQRCVLAGDQAGITGSAGAATAGRNWQFKRNVVLARLGIDLRSGVAAATADADLQVFIENNYFLGGGVRFEPGLSGNNAGGGLLVLGNCFVSPSPVVGDSGAAVMAPYTAGTHSTTTPSHVAGNLIIATEKMFHSANAGALVDDGYNVGISIRGANVNVTDGTGSVRNVPPHLVLPLFLEWGLLGTLNEVLGWSPWADGGFLNSAWAPALADFRVGGPNRPWGTGATIGAKEAGHLSQDTGSQITGGGANSLKITGAGQTDPIEVPVDAVSTTITIKTKSTSYGGTDWPQLEMLAEPGIGVTGATATATSASEQTLTIGPFTPTAKGTVRLLLRSRSSSTASATYFDELVSA